VASFVAALDQGTTSTRFLVFDESGATVAAHQREHRQLLPQPGWLEHDPLEIWASTQAVIETAMTGRSAADLAAIGVTNQRETAVVWNRRTGRPYANAIVWQDARTESFATELEQNGSGELIAERTGLRPSSYFSAGKLSWILEHVDGVRTDAERGEALFGTVDSWLIWNLTGGIDGGLHVTDVSNAGRTMLMNLRSLDWDDELLAQFAIPRAMLATIRPSADPHAFGVARTPPVIAGVAITAALGDQHAALIGQACFDAGEAKNTYGTGNFLLLNTGADIVRSTHGLLTTVAYQFAGEAVHYALEGSVAVTGSAVQWLRDQLGLIASSDEIEALAGSVDDSGGVYFVPAFSGLFAPDWRRDARGAIFGLTRFNTKAHLARATLEAIGYQCRDVLDAMAADTATTFPDLKVDGGITANRLAMQLSADILGVTIRRAHTAEVTALGAAGAAGIAAGFFTGIGQLRANWHEDGRWEPRWEDGRRAEGYAQWRKAVQRTFDWA
jgi:glycerol kinase